MPLDWKQLAKERSERLASLIELNAPDCLIGGAWFGVWAAMNKAYGHCVFELGEAQHADFDRWDVEIDEAN